MTNKERIDNYLSGNMSLEEQREFMADCCLQPALGYMLTLKGLKRALA